ncbi:hypothetical protein THOM_3274, partial [Trachipleistophora hominis]
VSDQNPLCAAADQDRPLVSNTLVSRASYSRALIPCSEDTSGTKCRKTILPIQDDEQACHAGTDRFKRFRNDTFACQQIADSIERTLLPTKMSALRTQRPPYKTYNEQGDG